MLYNWLHLRNLSFQTYVNTCFPKWCTYAMRALSTKEHYSSGGGTETETETRLTNSFSLSPQCWQRTPPSSLIQELGEASACHSVLTQLSQSLTRALTGALTQWPLNSFITKREWHSRCTDLISCFWIGRLVLWELIIQWWMVVVYRSRLHNDV